MIKLHDETHHKNETSMITLHDTFWKKTCIQEEIPKRNHSNDKDEGLLVVLVLIKTFYLKKLGFDNAFTHNKHSEAGGKITKGNEYEKSSQDSQHCL
jgi:hypothetical protein